MAIPSRLAPAGLVVLLAAAWHPPAASCGGGPLQTVVAVNRQSLDSLTIANHYAQLRNLPSICIISLESVPPQPTCSVADFRSEILQPLLEAINDRGLAGQIDCLAYSADFPTAIDIKADRDRHPDLPDQITPVGAINGLTYLYSLTSEEQPRYLGPRSNLYARRSGENYWSNPFAGPDRALWDQAVIASGREFEEGVQRAQALLERHPLQYPLMYRTAGWMAQGGQHDEALELLQRARRIGWVFRSQTRDDEAFESLADDPRWSALLEAMPDEPMDHQPSRGFDGRLFWGLNGVPVGSGDEGVRYLLSTVLAVTRGRGTSVPEAIAHLQRSAAADETHPQGSFFFSISPDVRAQTRLPGVASAATRLRHAGHQVILSKERLPQGVPDLMGAMLGSATYDWPGSGSTLLPGAIAENLTSTSGVLHRGGGQTPMVELLRGGAAGTSGTVTEPYALDFKFPKPMLYAHYAQGSSLAEAFYQAVESPYQLLIVGDPLCQPYARKPRFELALLRNPDDPQQFALRLLPSAQASGDPAAEPRDAEERDAEPQAGAGREPRAGGASREAEAARWGAMEVYLNGRLIQRGRPAAEVRFSAAPLPPGAHEVAVVVIDRHALAWRGDRRVRFQLGDEPLPRVETQRDGEVIHATVIAEGAARVALDHLDFRLREGAGERQRFEIPIAELGHGPVRLTAWAERDGTWIAGEPRVLEIPLPEEP